MLRRIIISNLLFLLILFAGCSHVDSSSNVGTTVSDRSINGLQSESYVHLVNVNADKVFVRLRESFDLAWLSTFSAAELAGLKISEANVQRGFYILKEKEKEKKDKGFVIRTSGVLKYLESLESFGSGGEGDGRSVRIRLISLEDNSTKIVPVNEAGNWDTRDVATAMIKKLYNAFSEDNRSANKTEELNNTQHSATVVAAASSQVPVSVSDPVSNVSSVSDSTILEVKLIHESNDRVYIHLQENFEQAWFSTARGLKQAGINISKADSLHGIYTLGRGEMEDEGMKVRFFGVFKRFESPGSDDDERDDDKSLRLRLKDLGGSSTKIVPVDDNGEWDTSDKAIATVNQLYRSLNQL